MTSHPASRPNYFTARTIPTSYGETSSSSHAVSCYRNDSKLACPPVLCFHVLGTNLDCSGENAFQNSTLFCRDVG